MIDLDKIRVQLAGHRDTLLDVVPVRCHPQHGFEFASLNMHMHCMWGSVTRPHRPEGRTPLLPPFRHPMEGAINTSMAAVALNSIEMCVHHSFQRIVRSINRAIAFFCGWPVPRVVHGVSGVALGNIFRQYERHFTASNSGSSGSMLTSEAPHDFQCRCRNAMLGVVDSRYGHA